MRKIISKRCHGNKVDGCAEPFVTHKLLAQSLNGASGDLALFTLTGWCHKLPSGGLCSLYIFPLWLLNIQKAINLFSKPTQILVQATVSAFEGFSLVLYKNNFKEQLLEL